MLERSRKCSELTSSVNSSRYTSCMLLCAYYILQLSKRSVIYSGSDTVLNCKKVMWGRVIQADLLTWPWKVGGHYLHSMWCKTDDRIFMPNFVSLFSAVSPLSTNKLRGWVSVRGVTCIFTYLTHLRQNSWYKCPNTIIIIIIIIFIFAPNDSKFQVGVDKNGSNNDMTAGMGAS